MTDFEKWLKEAKERPTYGTTRQALRMLEVAIEAMGRASMAYFREEEGVDKILAEAESEIGQITKEK